MPRTIRRTALQGRCHSVPWDRLGNQMDEWEFIQPNVALLEVILANGLTILAVVTDIATEWRLMNPFFFPKCARSLPMRISSEYARS